MTRRPPTVGKPVERSSAEVTPGPLAAAVERWCLDTLPRRRDPQWQRSWWEQYLGRELTQRDYALVGKGETR